MQTNALTLKQVAEERGVDQIRCPYCGHRSESKRFIRDLCIGIREAVLAGKSIRIPFVGTIAHEEVDPDILAERDSLFSSLTSKLKTLSLRVPRDSTLQLNGWKVREKKI